MASGHLVGQEKKFENSSRFEGQPDQPAQESCDLSYQNLLERQLQRVGSAGGSSEICLDILIIMKRSQAEKGDRAK